MGRAHRSLDAYLGAFWQLDRHEIAALALTLGILCFAVVTAVLLVRTRRRLVQTEASARDEIIAARAESDRVYALLRSEPQIMVAWAAAGDEPEIIGDPSLVSNSELPQQVLAFGSWLDPEQAQAMELAVDALRARGEAFAKTLTTLAGRPVEAKGHIVGGRAIMRLKEVGGVKRDLAELQARFQKLTDDAEAFRTLVEALPAPIWARDEAGKLNFVNAAYARAVEAKDAADAVQRGIELFDRAARDELNHAQEAAKPYTGRLPAIVAGSRRSFDVLTFPSRRGSAGIAIDATETETMRIGAGAHGRRPPAHARSVADRRRHLRRRSAAGVPQRRLSIALGPRRRIPRSGADRFRAARSIARRPQVAGAGKLPPVAREPARGLSRGGSQGAYLASAGRSHRAGGDDSQSRRRRDLSVP